jgi:hypothetical protein
VAVGGEARGDLREGGAGVGDFGYGGGHGAMRIRWCGWHSMAAVR